MRKRSLSGTNEITLLLQLPSKLFQPLIFRLNLILSHLEEMVKTFRPDIAEEESQNGFTVRGEIWC